MPVESKHPEYQLHVLDWEACRDVYHGQSAVARRDCGKRYLPPTVGMRIDWKKPSPDGKGGLGELNYEAYLGRATLGGFFADAVDTFMGMLWHRPTVFELGMLEDYFGNDKPATSEGESLKQLLKRMHGEAFVAGRMFLMGDLPAAESTTPQPYLELYTAEQAINWDDGKGYLARRTLNLVVLDESGFELNPASLDWQWKCRYRVLKLGSLAENESVGVYQQALVSEGALNEAAFEAPELRRKTLGQIPAVFVGAKRTTTEIDDPPLLALARSVLSLWRLDADYKQQLHMQGQDTLVTIGAAEGEVTSVGAGAHINIANPKGDGKFIGISGSGLGEVRQAIENERAIAAKKSGEMLADNSKQRQSGEALAEHTTRKGASLLDIAQTCAAGLQQMLRIIAKWLGASQAQLEEIKVIPNDKFGTPTFVTADMKALVEAYVLGAPITLQSIHEYNVAHGYTTLTWDDMIAQKKDEVEQLADLLPMPAPKAEEEPPEEEDDAAE